MGIRPRIGRPKVSLQLDERVRTRFWTKVNKDGPVPSTQPELGQCWEWIGSRHPKGYGQISVGGRGVAPSKASRISWLLNGGSIPAGTEICHKCDNPPCVRPSHLFVGTHQQNLKDFADKGFMRTASLAALNPVAGAKAMWLVPGQKKRQSDKLKQQWEAAKAAGRNTI